jgi:hypothetical protein
MIEGDRLKQGLCPLAVFDRDSVPLVVRRGSGRAPLIFLKAVFQPCDKRFARLF